MTELEIRQNRAREYSERVKMRRNNRIALGIALIEFALGAFALFCVMKLYW